MNKGKHYILPEGTKIEKVSIDMFKAGDGYAYQDERLAEYNVAIGSICECGNFIEGKDYTACTACREKRSNERYNALELVEWDYDTPLTLWEGDAYFFDEEDIDNYCEYEDISKSDLQLVLCEPNESPNFDINDFCEDCFPEDRTLDISPMSNESWAVICVKGKQERVTFADLSQANMVEITRFLKQFQLDERNIFVDSPYNKKHFRMYK